MSRSCLTLSLFLAFSPPAWAQASFRPADFDRYVGAYQISPGKFLWLRRDGDRLFVRFTGQDEHEAIPQSPTVLVFLDAPMQLTLSDMEAVMRNGTNERRAPRVSA